MVQLGFGSHPNCIEVKSEEVFVVKYKILTICSNNLDKFSQALTTLGISLVDKLYIVWDNFLSKFLVGRNSQKLMGKIFMI